MGCNSGNKSDNKHCPLQTLHVTILVCWLADLYQHINLLVLQQTNVIRDHTQLKKVIPYQMSVLIYSSEVILPI